MIAEAFQAQGLDFPRVTVFSVNTPIRISLLATGRFISIIPESAVTFSRKNAPFKVLPVDLPTTREAIGVITLKHRTLTPIAQLFVDCARDVAKTRKRN